MTKPSTTPSEGYWREAVNTLKANGWTLLLARLFGKRSTGYDDDLQTFVRLVTWRGKTYML